MAKAKAAAPATAPTGVTRAGAYAEIETDAGTIRVERGDYVVIDDQGTRVMPPEVYAVEFPDAPEIELAEEA